MTLPASLLAAAEAHPCFTGCYSHEAPVALVIDPNRHPVTSFHAACQDCPMFHVGALASLLPPGTTQYTLAQELASHMRTVRGYRWAFSGYHATGPGFWLSAAYYGDGLFLVDSSRNHGGVKDVDWLVDAFRSKLATPDDPGMLDPALYATDVVHLSCSPSLGPVRTKQDILNHSQCSLAPRQGFRRVAIVEFLPLTTQASSSTTASPAVMQRLSTYIGGATQNAGPSTKRSPPAWSAADEGKTCSACNRRVNKNDFCGKTTYDCMC